MIIKVLGPGCAKCTETAHIVTAAIQESGSDAVMEKISDLQQIMALGVMSTPAVVIGDTIMCLGRVPSKDEVKGWLASPNAAPQGKPFVPPSSGGCCCCGSK